MSEIEIHPDKKERVRGSSSNGDFIETRLKISPYLGESFASVKPFLRGNFNNCASYDFSNLPRLLNSESQRYSIS